MIVRLFFGRRSDIRTAILDKNVDPPRLLPMFMIGTLALAYLSPVPGLTDTPLSTRIAFWAVTMVLFGLHYFGAELLIVAIGKRLGRSWVPEPLISVVALAATTAVVLHLTRRMPIPYLPTDRVLLLSVANFLWVQLSVHIYIVFIDRSTLGRPPKADRREARPIRPADERPAPPPAWRVVDLGGLRLLEADVLTLVAQGHYVEVRTPDRSHLVRASLRAMVDRLPPDSGIQVSRSAWVSRRCKVGIRRDHGSLWLELDGDRRIEVSRSRQKLVLDMLMSQGHSGTGPDGAA